MTELTIESNLKSLAEKIKSSRQLIRSEEHTKMAYVVPFIALFVRIVESQSSQVCFVSSAVQETN